jgi:predicted short-subunit dehydrogenase-like oxidoreductase (DUF2520 family)
MRPRYHAAAGYVSQFINVLFDEAAGLWATWGATEAQAVQALLPLARGTLEAIGGGGIARAMPGPVYRGDVGSIVKLLHALPSLEGGSQSALYRALCAATVDIATRSGAIDAATARRFEALLASAGDGHPIGSRTSAEGCAAVVRPVALGASGVGQSRR